MHVDDLQEVNLQEAIRRSLCDEPQTPQQTQGPEANREEVISSAEPLALADQEVFVKDFREQVMQRVLSARFQQRMGDFLRKRLFAGIPPHGVHRLLGS